MNDDSTDQKWILLSGCNFESQNRPDEFLINFSQDIFTVTFPGVINQWEVADTNEITIEIYQDLDEATGELTNLSDGPSGFFIDQSSFTIEVKELQEASLVTTGTKVGQNQDNEAVFTFTPIIPLSKASGMIVIESPVGASQFDGSEMVDTYPNVLS